MLVFFGSDCTSNHWITAIPLCHSNLTTKFQRLGAAKNPEETKEPEPKLEEPAQTEKKEVIAIDSPGHETPDLIKETKDKDVQKATKDVQKSEKPHKDKVKDDDEDDDETNDGKEKSGKEEKSGKTGDWDMFAEQDNFDSYDVSVFFIC